MKKVISLFLAFLMLISVAGIQSTTAYSATKVFAEDKLESIQTQSGYIPGKTACVTGNCYGFISKVCEKLYGVAYNGEGLYGNYKCSHSTGNYYTVSTYTTSHKSPTSSDVDDIIDFFVNNAVSGDVIHYGVLTSGTSNTSTHTFMIQSVDDEKMRIYHANYETVDYSRSACHIDTIYWDSFRDNPTKNTYTSSGSLYSLNAIFYNKMKNGGMGITINRYSKYNDLFYVLGVTVPTVTTTRSSTTGVKVSWDSIAGAEKYQIQYKKSGDSSYKTASNTCTSTSYTINTLTTGATYYFRVRAYIGGKWMDYSDAVSKKVLPPTITNVEFETTTSGLKMTWGKRTDITGVRIYRSTSSNGKYNLIKTVTNNNTSSFTDTDVTVGKNYYYKFVRYITDESTEYSTTSDVKTASYILAIPTVTSSRNNCTTLTYKISGDNLQSSFEYYVSDSDGNYVVKPSSTSNSSVKVDNLETGEEYTIYVAEKNKFGTSEYAEHSKKALPASPSSVSAVETVDGIKVNYTTESDVDGYYIYRSTSSNGTYSKIGQVNGANVSSYVDTTVKYNTNYYYKVKRFVKIDNVTYSSSFSPATSAVKNTVGKTTVKVSRKTPTSVTVKWNKVSNANNYIVEYKVSGGSWKKYATTSCTSKVVSSLTTGSTYSFRVKAMNSIGTGSASSSVDIKVLPPTPTAPKLSKNSSGIKVSWTAQSNVTGYKIYRSTSKDGTYTLVKTLSDKTKTSWTDKSVSKNKTYYYKIVYFVTKNKKDYNSSKSPFSYVKFT